MYSQKAKPSPAAAEAKFKEEFAAKVAAPTTAGVQPKPAAATSGGGWANIAKHANQVEEEKKRKAEEEKKAKAAAEKKAQETAANNQKLLEAELKDWNGKRDIRSKAFDSVRAVPIKMLGSAYKHAKEMNLSPAEIDQLVRGVIAGAQYPDINFLGADEDLGAPSFTFTIRLDYAIAQASAAIRQKYIPPDVTHKTIRGTITPFGSNRGIRVFHIGGG